MKKTFSCKPYIIEILPQIGTSQEKPYKDIFLPNQKQAETTAAHAQ